MAILKLLADDLTGALDTVAEFIGVFGPLPVIWPATSPFFNHRIFPCESCALLRIPGLC